MKLFFKKLSHAATIELPAYATADAAGLDLRAALKQPVSLEPGGRCLVPTGLIMALPNGYEAQIRPRSGLALRHGVTLLNTPGTIDADYRGEIKVLMINLGEEPFNIHHGDRIAQMVIAPVVKVSVAEKDILPDSGRGPGGFGSTGKH